MRVEKAWTPGKLHLFLWNLFPLSKYSTFFTKKKLLFVFSVKLTSVCLCSTLEYILSLFFKLLFSNKLLKWTTFVFILSSFSQRDQEPISGNAGACTPNFSGSEATELETFLLLPYVPLHLAALHILYNAFYNKLGNLRVSANSVSYYSNLANLRRGSGNSWFKPG